MIPTGTMIDNLSARREEIRDLTKQVEELKRSKAVMESDIMDRLEKEGVTGARSEHASVSVTENVKPQVNDWPTFYRFIAKNDYFHLLDRRPSVTGCRELFETKGAIPGVTPFIAKTLNLRNL